uniref:Lol14.2a n=1 Tax=Bichromomyia olmeca TaxID=715919 RepID=A0A1B1V3F5_9DIPT|nr:Lol14.2a [Bichromomyia olmeca]
MNYMSFIICFLLATFVVKQGQALSPQRSEVLPKDREDCIVSLMTPMSETCKKDIDDKPINNGKETYIKCKTSENAGSEYTFYDCFNVNVFVSPPSVRPEPITYSAEAQVSYALVKKHYASQVAAGLV